MNVESKRVDADQCAGEGKMAAGVVEFCISHCSEFVLNTFDDW